MNNPPTVSLKDNVQYQAEKQYYSKHYPDSSNVVSFDADRPKGPRLTQ